MRLTVAILLLPAVTSPAPDALPSPGDAAMTALAATVSVGRASRQSGGARQPDRAVDGIAAVVNGEVISIGEVHRTLELLRQPRLAPLAGGCGVLPAEMTPSDASAAASTAVEPGGLPGVDEDPESLSAPERIGGGASVPPAEVDVEQALECLIDGILVFREVRRFPRLAVTPESVQAAYEGLVESFPSRQEFDAAIREHDLTVQQVRRDLEQRLLVAAYVDNRFRAAVQVSDEEVRRLWKEELAPGMRERGIEPPALEAVASEYVRPILREREVNRRVQSWIRDLRRRAEVRRLYPSDEDA